MESMKIKYNNAQQALKTFADALEKFKQCDKLKDTPLLSVEEQEMILRDSVIKRFEYSIDTAWKYLKEYLLRHYGVEQNSPKNVFRECLRNKLLTESEADLALEMVDSQNLTSHTYREELADIVAKAAGNYYQLLFNLLEKTKS